MNNKNIRSILSFVLSLVLLVSCIPCTGNAAGSADIQSIKKPTGLMIVEDYDDYIGDNWIEALALPQTVKVTLANGAEEEVLVNWDASVIDTRTTGYYSVPGEIMLPAGVENSNNLTVSITVQVCEYKNLIANPGFEENLSGWYLRGANPNPSRVGSPVHRGSFAAVTGVFSSSAKDTAFAETRNTENALGAAVAQQGGGQFYFSAWSQASGDTVPAGLKFQTWLYYKTKDNFGNLSGATLKTGTKVSLNNTEYVQSSGILDLPADTAWVRMDLRVFANKASDLGTPLYLDEAELVLLKTALKAEPAAIAEIKTAVLSRSVVQNYPDYVGEDWKSALGLPASVEVLTDNGNVVSVDVTWSYAGLDFTKYGKYTLTGTLDDGSFPNPKGLTVKQNIYVGKANNLVSNPSFESDLNGWYLRGGDPNPDRVQDAAKDGKYAALTGAFSSNGTDTAFAETRNMTDTLGAAVAQQGGGQFYFSAWSKASDETVPAGLKFQTWLYYKTANPDGSLSSATLKTGTKANLNNKAFVQSAGILDMPSNTAWIRMDMRVSADQAADLGAPLYLDHVELIPINVTIPKDKEPADVTEVLTEIPARAVVKNYDSFVGSGWQTALGLPASVEVMTSAGNTANVGVTWDYTNLNLKKTGKYTLIGTLDNSIYPNPLELVLTQVIYIREYKNLIPNASFEGNLNGWYLRGENPNPSRVESPVKDGKYAAMTGAFSSTKTESAFAELRGVEETIGTSVALQGEGQYYFSAWAQSSGKTLADGTAFQSWLYYKTMDYTGALSSSSIKTGEKTELSNAAYVQSAGIVELPDNTAWIRMDMRIFAQNAADIGTPMYLDDVELVPLNIIVHRYEGAIEAVETIIPSRKIIKNYPDYIGEGYTTADLMLPETVEVRSTKGEIVNVGVNWDYHNLNLSKTGKYTLTGSLEDMRLDNPNGLTVDQVIYVVEYENLLKNPSFEEDNESWKNSSYAALQSGISSPIKDGALSIKLTLGKLANYGKSELQTLEYADANTLGLNILQTGAGRYYFGTWGHGTESSTDIQVQAWFWYRSIANGHSSQLQTAPRAELITNGYVQSSSIVDVPDDVYWARLDLYILGEPAALSDSILYVDKMELVPLNVEVPGMNDIIDCEEVADAYVHQGTAFADLDLPETLQIQVKSGQKLDIPVEWDAGSYQPNKIGVQTITGTLDMGKKYNNPKNFAPTVKVTVRAKGEDLRQTIYISTSGSESNDGLSPENPKQDVKNIPNYLAQGYNVKLKRGDTWYLPTSGLTFRNLHGTEKAPLTVSAYGSGDELPTIAYMMKIEDSAWELVDEKRNVYAADVSALGQRDGIYVHRCFVDDEAYLHKNRTNYIALSAGEYCSYGGKLYIRMKDAAPENVEVTTYGKGGERLYVTDVSYLTFDQIHFKGGNAFIAMMRLDAPSKFVKFQYCSITHTFYYVMLWESEDEQIHYKPEISNCYIDSNISAEEGNVNDNSHWEVHSIEGITMRDGVDGAWIHHNHIRQMSHAAIAIESTQRQNDYKTTGVRNCIIEDNLLEGGNANYARSFNICGGLNQSYVQMCHDNTYRRNRCYDMTIASHLFGENNLIYSNVFSYVHVVYDEDGNLFDGKVAQSYAFDTVIYGDHTSVGNMLINNTFYNVSSAISINDTSHTAYNNLYANNLIVNWTSDPGADRNAAGAIFDNSVDLNYVMNNGVFSYEGLIDHFVVDKEIFSATDVNNAKAGYSGNIAGDPLFVDADLSNMEKGARLDFTLSNQSPMRYAGLSLYDDVYKRFPAWERLAAEYTDINGVVYLAESPSIGAWSFCERITGNVVEVDKQFDILARPGATIEQLNLPDAVRAINEQGIDAMLLTEWSAEGFDGSKPGTYKLTATLRNGPHTQLNINGKVATINVNVKDKLRLLSITTILRKLTVLYGTSLEAVVAQLPTTLEVMEESGYQDNLPVTWVCERYDPTTPDAYTFKCVLPEDKVSNARDFPLEVEVRVLHEIGRGTELLINPDFTDGPSASPWKIGWGDGNMKITTDPQYVMPGESSAAIVTVSRKYASLQQDVVGQMQLLGEGKYLFKVYMRSYDPARPIDSSYAAIKVWGPKTYVVRCRTVTAIGTDWVEFSAIMDITDVMQATEITFHTSTGKSDEDVEDKPKSYIISGCSLVYLGKTDAEVEATLDSLDLVWNTIKGENETEKKVASDLNLPTSIGSGSAITWTSSDETAITKDGRVTMGRIPKTVVMTATITYNGMETVKKFTLTVPRDPSLPVYTGSLAEDQTVKVGDAFMVVISTKSDNATAYNAFRFAVSFNTSVLEYVGIDGSFETKLEGGRLEITGIGTEYAVTNTITVTFKAKKSGITDVKLVLVEIDNAAEAALDELPTMQVVSGTATINVEKTGAADNTDVPDTAENDPATVWIIVGIVVAVVAASAVVVLILMKKKKQNKTEE